jgi:hypothetical protein
MHRGARAVVIGSAAGHGEQPDGSRLSLFAPTVTDHAGVDYSRYIYDRSQPL